MTTPEIVVLTAFATGFGLTTIWCLLCYQTEIRNWYLRTLRNRYVRSFFQMVGVYLLLSLVIFLCWFSLVVTTP